MASETRAGHRDAGPRTAPVVTRFLGRWLWSSTPGTIADAVTRQRVAYVRATVIVRAFYAVSVVWAVQTISTWPQYARLADAAPLWPARFWFDAVSVRTGVNVLFGAYLVASVVVALVPQQRWARAVYAFVLLQYMAFVNGFDKINHNLHAWLFVSVILILLPKGPWTERRRLADRQLFLTVIWTAQLVVLFFYTLTGAWKVIIGLYALVDGRLSGFHISGFSYIVGNSLLQTNQDAVLGSFFVHNEVVGWLLFLGTMYLESASILIAFRPRLHRCWGVALIAFHIGTQLAMGFTFYPNIALVGLLLVCSPMAPDHIRVKDAILDLPGVHLIAGRLASRAARRGARRRSVGPSSRPAPITL